ncbi:MAG: hypothetical protein ACEPOZ_00990 [Marinifilaceae bacterium]
MRKYLLALLILPAFVACNQKEIKMLKEQNAQLTQMAQEKDASLNEFVESMNFIEENLAIIKEKEQIIEVNAKENPNRTQKEKISSDLAMINDLLAQNKLDLEKLNKKLKNSWYQNSKLRKLVDRLQKQMKEKETALVALNEQVAKLNGEVENLNGQVTELNGTVVALNTENENRAAIIEAQTADLNSAYFVTGSAKELEAKNVIARTGGVLGLGKTNKLNKDFNAEVFQKIDLTQTVSIPVNAKKVSLVTSHPSDSYELEGNADQIEAIKILKPAEFWKASKYLVVAVK